MILSSTKDAQRRSAVLQGRHGVALRSKVWEGWK
jgi:hypothetical protein